MWYVRGGTPKATSSRAPNPVRVAKREVWALVRTRNSAAVPFHKGQVKDLSLRQPLLTLLKLTAPSSALIAHFQQIFKPEIITLRRIMQMGVCGYIPQIIRPRSYVVPKSNQHDTLTCYPKHKNLPCDENRYLPQRRMILSAKSLILLGR